MRTRHGLTHHRPPRSIVAFLGFSLLGVLALMAPTLPTTAAAQTPVPPPPSGAPGPPPPAAAPMSPPLAGPSVSPPPAAPAADAGDAPDPSETTPLRVSFVDGDVSFWREGTDDWTPARVNTPLASGDLLYAARGGNVEVQIGPRAFVRATDGGQIGVDSQEPGYLQLRLTAGTAALDLRQLPAGFTVEIDTPAAALTVDRAGLYRVDVRDDGARFTAHRGGRAVVTPSTGQATALATNQQAAVAAGGAEVQVGPASALEAWDQWNLARTDYLLRYADTRYVAAGVYGTEALAQHGTWRTAETYGAVWVPAAVPAGWAPYTTGRWIWDPRFGWTWLDDAPWGWAPYHYGRWVVLGNGAWAWAPGPVLARPVYAPALVVFLGGGHARPVCWAPLGWGEPVVPWWGRRGFVGVPWWGGWGGPRVVNNVVISRNVTVNVTNISVYRHVDVTRAVVAVPADRFGRGHVPVTRVSQADIRSLKPIHGAIDAKPVAASLAPAAGPVVRPPGGAREQRVVATRPPQDATAPLRAHGLEVNRAVAPPPRLVPAPRPMPPAAGPDSTASGQPHPPGVRGRDQGRADAGRPPGGQGGPHATPPGGGQPGGPPAHGTPRAGSPGAGQPGAPRQDGSRHAAPGASGQAAPPATSNSRSMPPGGDPTGPPSGQRAPQPPGPVASPSPDPGPGVPATPTPAPRHRPAGTPPAVPAPGAVAAQSAPGSPGATPPASGATAPRPVPPPPPPPRSDKADRSSRPAAHHTPTPAAPQPSSANVPPRATGPAPAPPREPREGDGRSPGSGKGHPDQRGDARGSRGPAAADRIEHARARAADGPVENLHPWGVSPARSAIESMMGSRRPEDRARIIAG